MRYLFCDVSVTLHCVPPFKERPVADIWQNLFSLTRTCDEAQTHGIHFLINESAEGEVAGKCLFEAAGFTVIETTAGYHLRSQDSFLAVDVRRSQAIGSLSESFFNSPLENQRGLFFFAFLLLVSTHGLYGLHASSVSYNGCDFLMVGDSGCGKTTLTVALVRNGWKYLSDDVVLLRSRPEGLDVFPFGRPFSCSSALIGHFPELRAQLTRSQPLGNGKRLLEVAPVYPGQFVSRGNPRVILFPEIVNAPSSRLVPVNDTETLIRLIKQGVGFGAERTFVVEHLAVLRDLVYGTRAFRLFHGADVHASSATVSELLKGIADCPAEPFLNQDKGDLIGVGQRTT